MPFPTTDYPTALDAAQSRTDYTDIAHDEDFNYEDEQIRKIQEYLGLSSELIGQRIAGKGPAGMVSPIASGAGNRAFKFAARNSFLAGYILSAGDAYDTVYTEKMYLNYLGVLWALGGIDASAMLKIPNAVLPAPGVAGRIHWDPATPGMKYDDGAAWNDVGSSIGAGSYLDWVTSYPYTEAPIPVEESIGDGYFDASLVTGSSIVYFRSTLDPNLSLGTASILLYDMGPKAGPLGVPRLVTTLSTGTNGLQTLEQALTIVPAAPGPNDILDSARIYEVVATSAAAAGDDVMVYSTGLDVR